MKILFKLLTLPIFIPYVFIVGGALSIVIGLDRSIGDFLEWWIDN